MKLPWRRDRGGWELHPCTPPRIDEIINDTHLAAAVVGNVWACACGRRWRLQEILVNETQTRVSVSYVEVLDLTDDDMDQVEAWANSSSPNGEEFWG